MLVLIDFFVALNYFLTRLAAYSIHFIIAGCLVLLEDLAYLLWILVDPWLLCHLIFSILLAHMPVRCNGRNSGRRHSRRLLRCLWRI